MSGLAPLAHEVEGAGRWLAAVYALDLSELGASLAEFLIDESEARRWLPESGPRSAVLSVEVEGELRLGLWLDPSDAGDPFAILEETSHLLCLAWHAQRDLPVSGVALELQAEVDRFLFARVHGLDPLGHLRRFRWAPWLEGDAPSRTRYEDAQRAGRRYCERLQRRFPRRRQLAGLLRELRRFYRASPQAKLRAAV